MRDEASYQIGFSGTTDHDYGDHGVEITYTLEDHIDGEYDHDSALTLRSNHLIFGNEEEIEEEYAALVDEVTDRFEYTELDEPSLNKLLEGETL